MGTLGFWRLAQADPDWIAAVDPDGTEHRAGDLLARANRLVHGLRELGLKAGDGICGLVPNGSTGWSSTWPRSRPAGTTRRSTGT